ncbi:hypothetical protein NUU61_001059 [Penicillium alfredii]|uniref:Uncharacterized protein n=1 Tax=Penicillium alfredii TaxID=1506179 RepID=A0A9W9GAR3_9EURO|nr:uncharacterized protein NUU61_001059 [Penicillium alfredii]KAJ5115300.1 hypothetical protein NUU61_001059 [Penicillium alfredii]
MAPVQRPSGRASRSTRPVRSSRTKVDTYHEDSNSGEENMDPESGDGTWRRASLSLRPRDPNRMYREESTDTSFDGEAESESDSAVVGPAEAPTTSMPAVPTSESNANARPFRAQSQPSRRMTASSKPKQSKRRRQQKREVGRRRTKRPKIQAEDTIIVGSGVIPPWQTLPYQVLFDIFRCASHPLFNEQLNTRTDSAKWLVNVGLLCRSFLEPAIAALYYSPPMLPAYKSHALMNLLSMPQESLSMNYASKVKELSLDVETLILYKSSPTLGYFDLPKFIERIPQVQTVRLYHRSDYILGIPPWNIHQSRWGYTEPIFSSIDNTGIRLRGWEWNSRFCETPKLVELMTQKHSRFAFHGLKRLRVLHLSESEKEADLQTATVFATALESLPELQCLEFLESSLVNHEILLKLPSALQSLTLCNCDRIFSHELTSFMKSRGGHLRELNLSHNRHLNLSFIQTLGPSCPNLERFKMDISMHDWSSYHDVEPHFLELLTKSEIPTWPEKLQQIELIQLRKWDDATAEVFFTSLIDAAPRLRDLRRMLISVILKIGWRDRASFRERWISQLERVFLRRSQPPNPNLRSIRKRPLQSGALANERATHPEDGALPGSAHTETADGGSFGPSQRHSARLAQHRSSQAEEITELSPIEPFSQPLSRDIQGMCDVVKIRIDNQRPTETQFNEDDFLDDELSGDEDWDGQDFEPAPGHAW